MYSNLMTNMRKMNKNTKHYVKKSWALILILKARKTAPGLEVEVKKLMKKKKRNKKTKGLQL